MHENLPKLNETIDQIEPDSVRSSLKADSKYLTDVAIRNIVDYIRMLEKNQGGDNGKEKTRHTIDA